MTLPINQIIQGSCLEIMRQWPSNSIDCCVTSPPYWGLRDYGTATWKGGDADCKHLVKGDGNLKSQKQLSNNGSIRVAKETCPACGAIRIDQQFGLHLLLE